MRENSKLIVSLDRIEDEVAVILTRDGQMWLVPVEFLPEGASEGDILDVDFSRNPDETNRLSGRVSELQQQLLDRTRERYGKD